MTRRAALSRSALLALCLAAPLLAGPPEPRLVFEGPCRDARDICPPSVLNEPSGLAFHPSRRTIFAVGDDGDIAELSLEGERLRWRHPGADLEGITIGPGGRVVAVVENPPALLFVDPDTLAIERRVPVEPGLGGVRVIALLASAGLEGIAYVPSTRRYYVANQHSPARILELEVPAGPGNARVTRIVAELSQGVECASDIVWDPAREKLLVTASSFARPDGTFRRGKLWEVGLDGAVGRSYELPGKDQEGFCVDDRGCAYVGLDSGGILKVEPARVGD